ncbi:sensory box/GGDEF family protein [Aeromonas diversa CDC 2478-85]|uniref:Sensory box/GGDEF family protein n=1 Tax=Aeromonas diversa CDC 2478-85 TaxID=1268237 RepID=N9U1Q9_9GAMM|nr:HDOD domain-containing protein [Aeromonas diversa]ENY72230.1 sensory box/GGDEF family protein [Aeromonas diversa CDC 2478-85]
MYSYVARQPILDAQQRTHAYELLFRDSLSNVFPDISSSTATTQLVVEQFLHQNIDQLLAGKVGLINFTHELLLSGLAECLPQDKVIIEILEDTAPDEALLQKVIELKGLGYHLALDDFTLDPGWEPFLPYIELIKFDLRSTSMLQIRRFIHQHRHLALTYLAEKVETQEEFERAKAAGISLFQGYFFSRPELVKRASLKPSQLVVMQLLHAVNQPEIDLNRVERLLSQDISLSLKLLRYVNYLKRGAGAISSFRQAAIYLGNAQLRRFVALVAAGNAGVGKSDELYQMSLIRARFCELLAESQGQTGTSEAFMAGLFSLLDVLMEQPMVSLLESIPLAPAIKAALLERQGPLGIYLQTAEACEQADWPAQARYATTLRMSDETLSQNYLTSTIWVSQLMAPD